MVGTQVARRRLLYVALGISLLGSITYAGWKSWPPDEIPVAKAAKLVISVRPAPADLEPAESAPVEPAPMPLERLFPNVKVPFIDEADETDAAPRRKAQPTGAPHSLPKQMLAATIRRLHSEAHQHFIGQIGAGERRMPPMLMTMKREWKAPQWTSEELAAQRQGTLAAKDLGILHRLSLHYFADSNGTPKEGRFASGDSSMPKRELFLEIKTLDLVGLVMHEEPVVYVSEMNPQMAGLSEKPKRELDVFEQEGLEELTNGKHTYVRGQHDIIRALGAIRAGKACLKCHHDSKEGDLLGAFSYTLREGHFQVYGRGGGQPAAMNAYRLQLEASRLNGQLKGNPK